MKITLQLPDLLDLSEPADNGRDPGRRGSGCRS
jgi:hypothetical protein